MLEFGNLNAPQDFIIKAHQNLAAYFNNDLSTVTLNVADSPNKSIIVYQFLEKTKEAYLVAQFQPRFTLNLLLNDGTAEMSNKIHRVRLEFFE